MNRLHMGVIWTMREGLFDFCRTGLNRLREISLNQQVSAGRNLEQLKFLQEMKVLLA